MGGTIRPFEKMEKPLEKGFATVKYVNRRLHEVLSKLHFTGPVSSSAEGQVQIEAGSVVTAACEHPLQVYVKRVGGVLKLGVRPGWVSVEGGSLTRPTLQSVSLLRDPPPLVAISDSATLQVWLDLSFRPILGTLEYTEGVDLTYLSGASLQGDPEIRIGGSSQSSPAAIDWETFDVADGDASLLLATVVAGEVQQEWFGSAFGVIADDLRLQWQLGGN